MAYKNVVKYFIVGTLFLKNTSSLLKQYNNLIVGQ